MKDGTYCYSIHLHAPIGPRYGTLELDIQRQTVTGALTMFSRKHRITDASLANGELRFSGRMQTLLYFLPYTAEGTADTKQVRLLFHTEKGCFPAEGAASREKEQTV